jgi:hypothetical protein
MQITSCHICESGAGSDVLGPSAGECSLDPEQTCQKKKRQLQVGGGDDDDDDDDDDPSDDEILTAGGWWL